MRKELKGGVKRSGIRITIGINEEWFERSEDAWIASFDWGLGNDDRFHDVAESLYLG